MSFHIMAHGGFPVDPGQQRGLPCPQEHVCWDSQCFAGVPSYLCISTPVAQPQPAMTLGNETMDLKLMAWAGPWKRQGAVRKPASRACFHKGSRILSEVQGLLSQLGESFPAKQEAVPESWPPGGHWCPGTSTLPAHSVRRREVLL